MIRVGIIGAGLIGQKRAASLKGAQLVSVCDPIAERAQALAHTFQARVESDWQTLVAGSDIDAVLVCTPHNQLAHCAIGAIEKGKAVLIEKPGARTTEELRQIRAAAQKFSMPVRIGYNHRFHPALLQAKALVKAGTIGPLLYIRARYGHGARPGYEKEWRANAAISGGGELIDQGVHLIDLARWYAGNLEFSWGRCKTSFWPMKVEDNGILFLESADHSRWALLHASWTEWKNLFDFEIFGQTGKIEISGLGRSYGVEELRVYRMKPEMGPPEIQITPFPEEDVSWQSEFNDFLNVLHKKPDQLATLDDALHTLEVVESAYR